MHNSLPISTYVVSWDLIDVTSCFLMQNKIGITLRREGVELGDKIYRENKQI